MKFKDLKIYVDQFHNTLVSIHNSNLLFKQIGFKGYKLGSWTNVILCESLQMYAIVKMASILDQSPSAYSLKTFLKNIDINDFNGISKSDIKQDLEFLRSNPLVLTVIKWRNNKEAHTNRGVIEGKNTVLLKNPLKIEDIENLIIHLTEMLEKYLNNHIESTNYCQLSGYHNLQGCRCINNNAEDEILRVFTKLEMGD